MFKIIILDILITLIVTFNKFVSIFIIFPYFYFRPFSLFTEIHNASELIKRRMYHSSARKVVELLKIILTNINLIFSKTVVRKDRKHSDKAGSEIN